MYVPSTKKVNVNCLNPKKQPNVKSLFGRDFSKEHVLKWLHGLTQLQRWTVMTIRNERMRSILDGMITQTNFEQKGYTLSRQLNCDKERIYARECYKIKNVSLYSKEQVRASEQEVLRNVVLLRDTGEISLRRSFINDQEKLLFHISVMTNDMVFDFFGTGTNPTLDSIWFNEKDFHSMCEWLIHSLENEIMTHYTNNPEVPVYELLEISRNISTFASPTLKDQYFTPQTCRQHYKDKRIPNTDEGRKNIELNIFKILELANERSEAEITDDVLFKRLLRNEDKSYEIYLDTVFDLVLEVYSNHELDELMKMTEGTSKTKSFKKNRKKKKSKPSKGVKGNSEVEVHEEEDKGCNKEAIDDDVTQDRTEEPEEQQIHEPLLQKQQHQEEEAPGTGTNEQNQLQQVSPNKKNKKKKSNKKVQQFVSNCIKQYIDNMSLSSNKLIGYRASIYARLQASIDRILKEEMIYIPWELRIFGSCALGLSTEQSDIDIVLVLYTSNDISAHVLEIFHNYFLKEKWVTSSKLIPSSVPIIKLEVDLMAELKTKEAKLSDISTHKNSKKIPRFEVDLSIETEGSGSHQGIKTTMFTQQLLKQHKQLREITLFLKVFLKSKNLHLTFLGGINSYVLFLMVYALLKQRKLLCYPNIYHPLEQTLLYYSSQFEVQSTIIDVRLDKPMTTTIPILERLSILDPLSETGKLINTNSSQLEKIQDLFQEMHRVLVAFRRQVEETKRLDQKATRKGLERQFEQMMREIMAQEA